MKTRPAVGTRVRLIGRGVPIPKTQGRAGEVVAHCTDEFAVIVRLDSRRKHPYRASEPSWAKRHIGKFRRRMNDWVVDYAELKLEATRG